MTPSGTPIPIPVFAAELRPKLVIDVWLAIVEEELGGEDDDDLMFVDNVVDIIEEKMGLETTEEVDDETHDATEGTVTPFGSQSWSTKVMVAM